MARSTSRTVDLEALARVGRALADDTRRRLLVALLDGPAYPSELTGRLGTTKANISNHLACLRSCGLVTCVHEGRRVRYEIADPRLSHALDDLLDLVVLPDCPDHVDGTS
jgi:DNA-binding transcriptional ArsR family regulator